MDRRPGPGSPPAPHRPRPGPVAPPALTAQHVELLRGLVREPMRDRRGRVAPELDDLVARGLASSTFVGHAGIELTITEAGRRALAAVEAGASSSVYDLPAVKEELAAFVAAWSPVVGAPRLRAFKANLAFLLDLAVAEALGAFDGPPGRPPRGRSSRAPAGS